MEVHLKEEMILNFFDSVRVIFMEDHIPIRPDRRLLLGRQTFKWSLWDVVFHENNSSPQNQLDFVPPLP